VRHWGVRGMPTCWVQDRLYRSRGAAGDLTQVETYMASSTTILVVKWDEQISSLVRSTLEGESYEVIQATSMFETLQTVRTGTLRAVVLPTDFLIADGGWMLGEAIWEERKETAILFIRGWTDSGPIPRMAGPHAVLSRPIRRDELMSAVGKLLGCER